MNLAVNPSDPLTRCGIDTVEINRIDRWLRETPRMDLLKIFSEDELCEAGDGADRVARVAARFAAKEACLKLFPRETALGHIGPADFTVVHDGYGAARVGCSPRALALLGRHGLSPITLSLTHDKVSAAAVALTAPVRTEVPLAGKLIYHLLPIRRRVVLSNLRRVFGATLADAEIKHRAQAHYGHLLRTLVEIVKFPWLSAAQQAASVRIDNIDAILRAHALGKGVLVLTGHFGNWEVATVAGIANFPQYRGQFHFVRRALRPQWLDTLVTRRFQRAGLNVLSKKGTLDVILDRLARGDAVIFVLDQHAAGRDGVQVEFFGHSAGTFRSLAVIALATGAPVVPAASWREPDGRHVLRFEEALPVIECADPSEAIRTNTQAYNTALERLVLQHPEQWFWVHRRWKSDHGR